MDVSSRKKFEGAPPADPEVQEKVRDLQAAPGDSYAAALAWLHGRLNLF
jgi:hypothetical protein